VNVEPDLTTETGRTWARLMRDARTPATPEPKRPPAHVTGRLNKTEAAFARRLDGLKASGEVEVYWFEAFKLRLAKGTHYTPDFLVRFADGRLVFCEVKGAYVRPDSVTKWKVAAEMFPQFGWEMWQRVEGEWSLIRVGVPGGGGDGR
jgi:hypothetical protein